MPAARIHMTCRTGPGVLHRREACPESVPAVGISRRGRFESSAVWNRICNLGSTRSETEFHFLRQSSGTCNCNTPSLPGHSSHIQVDSTRFGWDWFASCTKRRKKILPQYMCRRLNGSMGSRREARHSCKIAYSCNHALRMQRAAGYSGVQI